MANPDQKDFGIEDQEGAKAYLKAIDAPHFFDLMLSRLLIQQPDNVLEFFLKYCEEKKDGGGSSGLDGAYNPKMQDDMQYLRVHSVTSLANEWLEQLIAKRPEDPINFHIDWLKSKIASEKAAR